MTISKFLLHYVALIMGRLRGQVDFSSLTSTLTSDSKESVLESLSSSTMMTLSLFSFFLGGSTICVVCCSIHCPEGKENDLKN